MSTNLVKKRVVRQKDNQLAIQTLQVQQNPWSLEIDCLHYFAVSVGTPCQILQVFLYTDGQHYPSFKQNLTS
jgi:hypothetical protein